ncbi:MAG: FixH family protein [Polyangiaceae bacterium]|nr:FixH family protein [Polyangiaceae bacterium]
MRSSPRFLAALLASLALVACGDDTPQASTGTGGAAGDPGSAGGGTGGAAGDPGSAGGGTGGAEPDPQPAKCSSDVVTDDFSPGMMKVGDGGYSVSLLDSVPAPPAEGDNAWTVLVLDPEGNARDGLTIDVYPFMPDHGHGTAVQAVVTPTGSDGTYGIEPLNLFMSGVWVVRLKLIDPETSAELDVVRYAFCIKK